MRKIQEIQVVVDPTLGVQLYTADGAKIEHGPVILEGEPSLSGHTKMTVEFIVSASGSVRWSGGDQA